MLLRQERRAAQSLTQPRSQQEPRQPVASRVPQPPHHTQSRACACRGHAPSPAALRGGGPLWSERWTCRLRRGKRSEAEPPPPPFPACSPSNSSNWSRRRLLGAELSAGPRGRRWVAPFFGVSLPARRGRRSGRAGLRPPVRDCGACSLPASA